MLTRRNFLKLLGTAAVGGLAAGTYTVWIEPRLRLNTTIYRFTPPRWTPGLKLRVAALSDPHLINPHMPVSHWEHIIAMTNDLKPDLVVLLGDYITSHPFRTSLVSFAEVAKPAQKLQSPLGTFAILGNHDWWEDKGAQQAKNRQPEAQKIFEDAGIPVLQNTAVQLRQTGLPFWLSGTDSLVAIRRGHGSFDSRADIAAALSNVTDDAPILHLAHEPDLFVDIPDRVSLTLSGHTHGGQIKFFGYAPYVPSWYGQRFREGHIIEEGRHLIVSRGLGCSGLPMRLGSPPEIVLLELG
jgi:uncharacterized protein